MTVINITSTIKPAKSRDGASLVFGVARDGNPDGIARFRNPSRSGSTPERSIESENVKKMGTFDAQALELINTIKDDMQEVRRMLTELEKKHKNLFEKREG